MFEHFFKNGIVNKSGDIRNRPVMLETPVVMENIQAFPDINTLFQLHQI